MQLKVVWSDFAEAELDKIFEYYCEKASYKDAKKIIEEIILEPNKLIQNTFTSQIEELLLNRENDYRYLICNHYKIIYSIDEQKGLIQIADVFDSRQNPTKIKRTK